MELEQQLAEIQGQIATIIQKQTEIETKINNTGGGDGTPEKTPAEIMKTYLSENGFKGENNNG